MLNAVNFVASEPNTIAPETRTAMEIKVFNTRKDSTTGTIVTLPRRYSSVEETITQVRSLPNKSLEPRGIIQSIRLAPAYELRF